MPSEFSSPFSICNSVSMHPAVRARARRQLRRLSADLAQACLGREDHAPQVELKAVRIPGTRQSRVFFGDGLTGEARLLATVDDQLAAMGAIRALLSQLRSWRERCEANAGGRAAKAMGVGA